MKKDNIVKGTNKYSVFILGFVVESLVSALFIIIFAAIMYFFEFGFEYATVFATLSVAIGCLVSSFIIGNKRGEKGILTGAVVGFITFLTITFISLIVDSGSVTINTVFHFVIFMLSSLIGGILGVNKKINRKYI